MRAFFVAFALLAAACTPAPQEDAQPPSAMLSLADGWAAPTPNGVDVSAGYITIENSGGAADRLVSVTSPRAERVEIHEMEMDGAVMRMRAVPQLEIPAGGAVTLAPGGLHLMFIGVTTPFAEGETIPVELTFEQSGAVGAALPVRIGAAAQGL
jgi:copper(I)-binding protein